MPWYKRTKRKLNRTTTKASKISMIQKLKFEMLSPGLHCNMVTGGMKHQFEQLETQIAHINRNTSKEVKKLQLKYKLKIR